jgi:hypothetical protein
VGRVEGQGRIEDDLKMENLTEYKELKAVELKLEELKARRLELLDKEELWMTRRYMEDSKRDLNIVISEVMEEFVTYNFEDIYRHCGYGVRGFDAGAGSSGRDMADIGYE